MEATQMGRDGVGVAAQHRAQLAPAVNGLQSIMDKDRVVRRCFTRVNRGCALTHALAFNAQIAHEPFKALLVAIVIFSAGKVSDVALAAPLRHPDPLYAMLRAGAGLTV
jgi:hypothetical protein